MYFYVNERNGKKTQINEKISHELEESILLYYHTTQSSLRFNVIPIKIPTAFFRDKIILKFLWSQKKKPK